MTKLITILTFTFIFLFAKLFLSVDLSKAKDAFTLATRIKPVALTELYFENASNLPHFIEPGENYEFAFTVHNLEGVTTDYTYVIAIKDNNNEVLLKTDKLTLKNNESITINQQIGPFNNQNLIIEVRLVEKNQKIHFLMEKL